MSALRVANNYSGMARHGRPVRLPSTVNTEHDPQDLGLSGLWQWMMTFSSGMMGQPHFFPADDCAKHVESRADRRHPAAPETTHPAVIRASANAR